ncbi:copia protein [Tanacetum coccineum]|uniref:Copia protein n=1 Tax=Tanacetum coccineum TaxID=301880 RepID=A0ABQ5DCE6_9ASTR
MEIQIGQMSKVLQERGFGSLPISTETNPRDQVKSISTAKADFSEIRRIRCGPYAVSNVVHTPEAQDVKIQEAFDHTLPQKEKNPGSFTLPCFIHNICFDKALVDLGASVSVMPFSTYTNLGLGILSHTRLTIELADRTIKQPRGIAENVLVGIGKFIFPIDFIILDIPEDDDVSLILGRPILSTAHSKIVQKEDYFKVEFMEIYRLFVVFSSKKKNGPTPHPMITDPPPTGSTIVPAPRKKLDSEFNDEENKLEMADTQAEIILSQGLPRHIFNILNQTITDSCGGGGDLWKQCRTTYMQDREEHYQQRKKNQFDEIRMKITQLEIPTHQMNTKFCQQSSAYLGSILTSKPTSLMPKRSSQETGAIYKYVDPLALCSHHHILQLLFIIPQTPSPQPTAQSPNDALMATMTQIANLLSVQRKALGNVGNTGAQGKKVICYNCRGEGHVARQSKEKGDVLDAEAESFLADVECTAPYDQPQALTTTNMFQANHEDAYDSDVDEGPNAAVAFMANLSSTSTTNNPVNENANIVARDMLQRFNIANTQLFPLHSKKPKAATADLHKDLPRLPVTQVLGPVRERAYWLPANEIASQASNSDRPVVKIVYGYLDSGCSRHMPR